MEKLTPNFLQDVINIYGETHTRRTTSDDLSYIKASLADALIDGLIKKDVFSRIKATGTPQRSDRNYLYAEEFEHLQSWLYEHVEDMKDSPFYLAALIELETGARAGEITALKISDIDFNKKTISITKSYSVATKSVTETKTKSAVRKVEVTNQLLDVIKYPEFTDDIFPSKGFRTNLSAHMDHLTKLAGVTRIKFHGLRHSHVSYLIHNDVDINYISKRVGHANIIITLSTYAHMLKEKEISESTKALNVLQNKNAI